MWGWRLVEERSLEIETWLAEDWSRSPAGDSRSGEERI